MFVIEINVLEKKARETETEWGIGGREGGFRLRQGTQNKRVTSRTFQFIIFHDILHDGYEITIYDN